MSCKYNFHDAAGCYWGRAVVMYAILLQRSQWHEEDFKYGRENIKFQKLNLVAGRRDQVGVVPMYKVFSSFL